MSSEVEILSRHPRSTNLSVGQLVAGRYRIVRKLGQGGMGAVYEATHITLGCRFAIKALLPEHGENRDAARRLLREAMIGASLESKYIAQVVDLVIGVDEVPLIVMQYVPGESLRSLLAREGALASRRAIQLVQQVCRGLTVAHARGIIHRDLKPSNLIITREQDGYEHCTILDYGVAKTDENFELSSEHATRTGTLVGTLAYMPPEQIRGEKGLDSRADIYALGAILYECLAGQRAFQSDSAHGLIYRILHERPPSLASLRPGLPRSFEPVILRAMAPEGINRFASAEAFAAALASLPSSETAPLARAPEDATEREVPDRQGVTSPRRPRVLLLAAAGAIGLLVLAGMLARRSPPAPAAPSPVTRSQSPETPSGPTEDGPQSTAVPSDTPLSGPRPDQASVPANGAFRLSSSASLPARTPPRLSQPPRPPAREPAEGPLFDMRNPYRSNAPAVPP